jgi:hypothetical protein
MALPATLLSMGGVCVKEIPSHVLPIDPLHTSFAKPLNKVIFIF